MNKRIKFEFDSPPCVKLWLKGFTQLQAIVNEDFELLELNIIQFYLRQGPRYYNTKKYRTYNIWKSDTWSWFDKDKTIVRVDYSDGVHEIYSKDLIETMLSIWDKPR